jgi:hypothetical protein
MAKREEDIIGFIEASLDIKGIEARDRARMAFRLALNDLATMREVPWNKVYSTFLLTSGTSIYRVGKDILADNPKIRGISEMWHTDIKERQIFYRVGNEFNMYARGTTETGRPVFWTDLDRSFNVEFYPNPDANYTIWIRFWEALALEDIPEDKDNIVIQRGIMIASQTNAVGESGKSPKFYIAREMFREALKSLEVEGRYDNQGNRFTPDMIIGGGGEGDKGSRASYSNYWGNL